MKLTLTQITWAKAQDWFVGETNGVLTVADRYVKGGQLFEERIVWNKSFGELRAWAGY